MPTPPSIAVNINVGVTGATPTPPQVIWQNLLNYLTVTNPGYTILPGALIEDILSTDVASLSVCDSAAVETINSLTPDGSNPWLLYKLGQIYGVPPGQDTNTSVFVVFSGSVGLFVPAGFIVTDGTYQYIVQDGGVIASDGNSAPLFCVATQPGAWAIPANSVNSLVTSAPSGYTLTVNNPNTGTPSPGSQTTEDYRSQVMQAGLASAQGMASFLKTQLEKVVGVQPRLVSVAQINSGGWEVIVGGGDPYQVAAAIYQGASDISSLVGSTIGITGITNATPGVVATDLNHGLITGQNNVFIAGVVGMTGVNGGPYTVTVIDETHFSFGVDTTSSGAYVSGGVVTPNSRNISVNVIDYPDTYSIPFVNPPEQAVTVQLTWNTNSPNLVSPTAVQQLGVPAIANYINGIPVGQPINVYDMETVFQQAIVSLVPVANLTRMIWTVSINSVSTPVETGTFIIAGDPESFFNCAENAVTINQG